MKPLFRSWISNRSSTINAPIAEPRKLATAAQYPPNLATSAKACHPSSNRSTMKLKRNRLQRNTLYNCGKALDEIKRNGFSPMLRKLGWCEMWWDRAVGSG
jgi:hypothetical protein